MSRNKKQHLSNNKITSRQNPDDLSEDEVVLSEENPQDDDYPTSFAEILSYEGSTIEGQKSIVHSDRQNLDDLSEDNAILSEAPPQDDDYPTSFAEILSHEELTNEGQKNIVTSDERTAPIVWSVGDIIDEKYEVTGAIQQGGMGIVYKVQHREWDIELAVKMPLPDLVANDVMKRRFILEAQVWVNLGLHPNIVQCWYVRELQGVPCVFMDYLSGGSLKDWIRAGKIAPEELDKILDLIIQACDGLHYAHEHGVEAHRDVKPGNLLLSGDGKLYVTDFGIVKYKKQDDFGEEESTFSFGQSNQTITLTGSDLGTPEYSAPEQWGKAKQADARADIYALGGILFELCCGRRPFDDGIAKPPQHTIIAHHLFTAVPDPRMFNQHIPNGLAELIMQCLAKTPEERPSSMAKLREQLVQMYHEITGKAYHREVPKAAELRSGSLNNRAVSLLDLGKKEEALATFDEALKFDAHHPESIYNKSLFEWRDETITDDEVVRRLKEAKQASWHAGLYLGLVHLERAAADEAEQELAEVLQHYVPSTYGLVWRALGDAQIAQEKFSEAEKAYQKALEFIPDDTIAFQRKMLAQKRTRQENGRMLFPWPRCLRILRGYNSNVSIAALTPNGRFALLGDDHEIQLWDLTTGRFFWTFTWSENRNFWTFKGFASSRTSVAITPDGTIAVSGGSYDTQLRLWDLATGKCLRMFKGHTGDVHALSMTSDGRYVVSGGADKTLCLWELKTGKCVRIFEGHRKAVNAVAISPDDSLILSGGARSVRIWDLKTGKYLRRFRGHQDAVTAIAITPNGRFVISGSQDNTLCLWRLVSGRPLRNFVGHTDRITTVAITSDGSLAISGSSDNTLRVWDISKGMCLRILKGHTSEVTDVAITSNGRLAISASRDKTLRVWSLATGKCLRIFKEFTYWLEVVALTPDGGRVMAGNTDEMRMIRLKTGEYLQRFKKFPDNNSIIMQQLARKDLDKNALRMESLPPGECFLTVKGSQKETITIPVTQEGRFAVSGGRDETLRLWDLFTGKCLWIFRGAGGLDKRIRSRMGPVAVSQDERLLISGWHDSSCRLWDLSTSEALRSFEGHKAAVTTVALTPDGHFAVSGSFDTTLRLWDVTTGQCLQVCEGHEGKVTSLAVTPDGKYLLSGSTDNTIRLWDLTTGKCLRTFEGHHESITAVAITETGQFAISRSSDRTFRLWRLDAGVQRHNVTFQVCRQQEHGELQSSKDRFLKYLNRAAAAMDSGKAATAYTFLTFARALPGYERDPEALALNARLGTMLHRKSLREVRLLRTLEKHENTVNSIAITPDGRFAISGSRDRSLRMWTLLTGRCLRTLYGHKENVATVAVTPDGHIAVSGSWDKTLRLWALVTGECLKVFEDHEDYVRTVAITPDGYFAVSGSSDNTLRLWSLATDTYLKNFEGLVVPLEDAYKSAELTSDKSLRIFRGHTADVDAIAVSPDGRFVVSGSWDRTLRYWSLTTGKCLRIFKGHEDYVTSVAITANGRLILSGSRDKTLRLWSVSRKKCLRVFEGHEGYVSTVAITSDGQFALSGSWDNTLRLWHLATGKCLRIFERHEDIVETVAMTPEGRFAVSGGKDKTLRVWEFDWSLALNRNINT